MSPTLNRRSLLAGAPVALGAAVGTFLLDPSPRAAHAEPTSTPPVDPLPDAWPSQEAAAVRGVVGASHGNFDRVRELVDARPELAKAAWDWGFGDWETALGAASHTGNREIADYLIDNGARPDIFTAAMFGNLAAVKAFVAAQPGIQRLPGPHGITLLAHARVGGEAALPVLRYLESLGDADVGAVDLPLELEQRAYVGRYAFGAATDDEFEVFIHRRGPLALRRADGAARTLHHLGDHVFHPAGAPSARIAFERQGDRVVALEIRNPEPVISARRRSRLTGSPDTPQ